MGRTILALSALLLAELLDSYDMPCLNYCLPRYVRYSYLRYLDLPLHGMFREE